MARLDFFTGEGAVNSPAHIRPANNGSFPLIDAHDVQVGSNPTDADDRLDATLEDIDAAINTINSELGSGSSDTNATIKKRLAAAETNIGKKVNTSDIQTTVRAAASASDSKVPSEKAVRSAIDNATVSTTATPTSGSAAAFSAGGAYTELNKKVNTSDIQGTVNTSSNPPSSNAVKTYVDAADALKVNTSDIQTTVRAAASASDSKIPSEKAVRSAIDNATVSTTNTPASGSAAAFSAGGAYTELAKKVNTSDIQTTVRAAASASDSKIPSEKAVRSAIDSKTITIDSTVTEGSANAVSGGAVYTQLATKQNALTFDTTPTASSSNPVTSGGVKAALDTKQNTLTYETTPIVGSVNPVTSTGIRNAIDTAAAQNLGAMQAAYDTFRANISARVSSLSNGMVACSNIAAETTAGDTRILLYTGTTNSKYTNGHWYYNSAPSNAAPSWTDGGAVGSAPTIDNTLTVEGAAANSKAVGDAIENIVTISNTQPGSNSGNKVWIKETTNEEVQVPTYAEHIAKANKADIATNNESDNGSGTITASKKYAIGDHFYINNTNTSSENYGVSTLYKATAAIASGAAIVVGTNCEASKVADEITSLSNDLDYEIKPYNAVDLLYKNRMCSNGTCNGVTYIFNGNKCSLSGTASGTSFRNIYTDRSNLPTGMKAGDVVHFKLFPYKYGVSLAIFFYDSNNEQIGAATYCSPNRDVKIPSNAVGMIIRINVTDGIVTNHTVTFSALLTFSNAELGNYIYGDRSNFVPLPFGYFKASGIENLNIIDMPENSFSWISFSKIKVLLSGTNMPAVWSDSDIIAIWCKETKVNASAVNRVFDLYNFTKTEKLVLLYYGGSSGVKYRWITSGGTINNYTINQYANEYNVTATPSITADTNNYLQPTGDQTDMAPAIMAMLTQSGVCNLAPGTFYVSGVDMPMNTIIRGCGAATNIILLNSVSDGYAIKMGNNCIVEDVKISGDTSAPTITSTIGTRHGIIWQGTATPSSQTSTSPTRGTISNVHLWYFSGSGLKCYGTGTGISNCLNVVNVYARECTVGINVELLSEYHRFTNVDCRGCYYGCINNGGNNVFVNCGFSKNMVGLLMDNSNSQSPNNSHGTFSGCIFNHSGNNNDGIAIHIIGCSNAEMFVGCQVFFGSTVIENSSGIVFSACNYKGSTGSPISINGGGLVKLVDCVFGSTANITITNNTATVVDGCYLRDGTAVAA